MVHCSSLWCSADSDSSALGSIDSVTSTMHVYRYDIAYLGLTSTYYSMLIQMHWYQGVCTICSRSLTLYTFLSVDKYFFKSKLRLFLDEDRAMLDWCTTNKNICISKNTQKGWFSDRLRKMSTRCGAIQSFLDSRHSVWGGILLVVSYNRALFLLFNLLKYQ